MDRLTKRYDGLIDIGDEGTVEKCVSRLAAYEDTGLMPDEIKNMQFCYSKALQKIRKQEAEKDGGIAASAWMLPQPPKGEKS
ncbi:MAG TPA: hypothetical protein VHP31_11840 [Caproicibacter sp.]|nr:hypothetical protein [Caproicibacter sp.]